MTRVATHSAGFTCLLLLVLGCSACGGSTPSSPTPSNASPTPPNEVLTRVTMDRADDVAGAQVKVMYVLSSDGTDRQLDQDGALATSVEAWGRWVERASGGQRVKLDTYQGALDIAFYRLPRTDADISSFGITAINEIQAGITAAGYNNPNKIYAVYYGGNNLLHCGQSLRSGGQAIAGAFLEATPAAFAPCSQQTVPTNRTPGLTRSPDTPGYWEFTMAHEVFHMLGAVPSCAPHFSSGSHVNDSPTDLMGVFTRPGVDPTDPAVRWNPSVIDFNRDAYYRHGRSCVDVAHSVFLTPTIAGVSEPSAAVATITTASVSPTSQDESTWRRVQH